MKNRMYIDEQAYYEQMAEIKIAARLSEYHRSLSVASYCEKADRLAEKSWGLGAQLNLELSVRQRTLLMEIALILIKRA